MTTPYLPKNYERIEHISDTKYETNLRFFKPVGLPVAFIADMFFLHESTTDVPGRPAFCIRKGYSDQIVGYARKGIVWVHPDHRGCGLGAELWAAMLAHYGPYEYFAERKVQLTTAGFHSLRAAHRLLINRGVIKEKPMHEDRNIWEFYVDAENKWRWRVSDKNGLELAKSSQGYVIKRDAEACAARLGWVQK